MVRTIIPTIVIGVACGQEDRTDSAGGERPGISGFACDWDSIVHASLVNCPHGPSIDFHSRLHDRQAASSTAQYFLVGADVRGDLVVPWNEQPAVRRPAG